MKLFISNHFRCVGTFINQNYKISTLINLPICDKIFQECLLIGSRMTYYPQPGFQQPTGMRHAIQPGVSVVNSFLSTLQILFYHFGFYILYFP